MSNTKNNSSGVYYDSLRLIWKSRIIHAQIHHYDHKICSRNLSVSGFQNWNYSLGWKLILGPENNFWDDSYVQDR